MTAPNTVADIARPLLEKTVDDYYCRFLSVENNRANILGRQVYSIERPALSLNTFDTRFKNERMVNNSTIIFQPFNIVFRDDDRNITNSILIQQVYRQVGVVPPQRANKTFENAKFDISVQVFNSQKEPIETFTIKGCFITNIQYSESIYTEAVPNRITVTANCDTIDYQFVDAYVLGTDLD